MSRTGFSVSWTAHSGAIAGGLQELQQRSEFVDMTIAADGHLVRVHQIVVGLASPYLKQMIRSASTPHPVLFLNNVSHSILALILEYMYTGEVVVPADELKNFVTTGKALHVKGLDDIALGEQHTYQPEKVVTNKFYSTDHEIQNHTSNLLLSDMTSLDNSPADLGLNSKNLNVQVVDIPDQKTLNLKRKMTTDEKKSKISKIVPVSNEEIVLTDDENVNSNDDNQNEESIDPEVKGMKPQVSYCLSNKGGLQMIVNRYMYALAHTYKDGRRRWECVDSKKKCYAGTITQGNELISRYRIHNHPRHDSKILKKVNSKGVFASLEVLQEKSTD